MARVNPWVTPRVREIALSSFVSFFIYCKLNK